MGEMMREVADDVRAVRVPGTGHFIAEENPVAMTEALLSFLSVEPFQIDSSFEAAGHVPPPK